MICMICWNHNNDGWVMGESSIKGELNVCNECYRETYN